VFGDSDGRGRNYWLFGAGDVDEAGFKQVLRLLPQREGVKTISRLHHQDSSRQTASLHCLGQIPLPTTLYSLSLRQRPNRSKRSTSYQFTYIIKTQIQISIQKL